ncbi:MAG TPA: hypothetical protein VEV45_10730 [Streptosporangiaceae bacterium]|nr:hypothetical protein [Streptosporangiaceae bacterium]
MSDETDNADLEEELRQVVAQIDSVPPALLEAAVGALAWRTIDADLAELVFDSLVDQDEAALVRGTTHGRMLSFRARTLSIDVEVTSKGNSRMMVGQLVPPQAVTVDIRHGDSVITIETDELGRFSAGPLQAGPTSLRCRTGGDTLQPPVATAWVAI